MDQPAEPCHHSRTTQEQAPGSQQPGHAPLSIDEIAEKLAVEYSDALELLGKL